MRINVGTAACIVHGLCGGARSVAARCMCLHVCVRRDVLWLERATQVVIHLVLHSDTTVHIQHAGQRYATFNYIYFVTVLRYSHPRAHRVHVWDSLVHQLSKTPRRNGKYLYSIEMNHLLSARPDNRMATKSARIFACMSQLSNVSCTLNLTLPVALKPNVDVTLILTSPESCSSYHRGCR